MKGPDSEAVEDEERRREVGNEFEPPSSPTERNTCCVHLDVRCLPGVL